MHKSYSGARSVTIQSNRLILLIGDTGVKCFVFAHRSDSHLGARALLSEGENNSEQWKYLPVRRLAPCIEESLYRGMEWAIFEPNDELLWSKLGNSVSSFMNGLFRNQAFCGTKPSEAYFVM